LLHGDRRDQSIGPIRNQAIVPTAAAANSAINTTISGAHSGDRAVGWRIAWATWGVRKAGGGEPSFLL